MADFFIKYNHIAWSDKGLLYHEARQAHGLGGELLIQEGKHHFSAIEGLNDGDSTLCKAVTDFMARCE